MSQQDVQQAGWDLVHEFEGTLGKSSGASLPVKEAYEQFKSAAAQMTAATEKLEADWSENKRSQLVEGKPTEAYNEDRWQLKQEALSAHTEGLEQAKKAYGAIRLLLKTEVLPKASDKPEQQLLDREMFRLAIGDGDNAQIGAKALRLAQNGDTATKAMLVSPYGRAFLKSKGVHEQTIADVEDTVIATSGHPSADLVGKLGRLEGAITALDTDWRMRVRNR